MKLKLVMRLIHHNKISATNISYLCIKNGNMIIVLWLTWSGRISTDFYIVSITSFVLLSDWGISLSLVDLSGLQVATYSVNMESIWEFCKFQELSAEGVAQYLTSNKTNLSFLNQWFQCRCLLIWEYISFFWYELYDANSNYIDSKNIIKYSITIYMYMSDIHVLGITLC